MQVFNTKLQTESILKDLKEIFDKGWIGLNGKVEKLEQEIAEYIGVKYCVCTNSCTAALHLAIKSLGLKKGDKVLTTPLTFVSTNHVLLYEGLEPVFTDVEKTTGVFCIPCFKKAIQEHDIKAIVCVHFAGYSNDMFEINKIAQEKNIPVIEDCAHAFGAKYKTKMIGDTDNLCCWSFHAVKNLAMGDGGAITTNNEDLYKYFKKMIWLGIDKSTYSRSQGDYKWEYDVMGIGYKYHMNDITATIGLNQLKVIDKENKQRNEIAEYYLENIKAVKPKYEIDRQSSYHFLPLFFLERDKVYDKLIKNGIYPGMHYKPNYYYSMYKDCIRVNNCVNTEWYYQNELTLPLHLKLTNDDLKKVCEIINNEN